MLRFLRIRNLAVIEAVEVEFDPGFNVLTGETGAGKSILWRRSVCSSVRAPRLISSGPARPHATIEAIFEGLNGQELIVRREISNSGAQPLVPERRVGDRVGASRSGSADGGAARPTRASGAARSAVPPPFCSTNTRSLAMSPDASPRVDEGTDTA
jgi:DNA repair exonuclease SbcCD ATPase subunit